MSVKAQCDSGGDAWGDRSEIASCSMHLHCMALMIACARCHCDRLRTCAGASMCPMGTYECNAASAAPASSSSPVPLRSDLCTTCASLPYTPCRRYSDGTCIAPFANTAACPVGSFPCPGSPVDLHVRVFSTRASGSPVHSCNAHNACYHQPASPPSTSTPQWHLYHARFRCKRQSLVPE